ncbi:hypothetical protein D1007_41578 [Hordeum vulgare]|nr:hypothetical protein D1007_41578 [Hordeum vulgare]
MLGLYRKEKGDDGPGPCLHVQREDMHRKGIAHLMAKDAGSSSSSSWMGRKLEDMLQHLDLKDEELDDVVVGEAEVKKLEEDARWLAIGRLHTSHPFSSAAMFETLKAVWGLAKPPKYREAGDNLFQFQMQCLGDWKKVVHEGRGCFVVWVS